MRATGAGCRSGPTDQRPVRQEQQVQPRGWNHHIRINEQQGRFAAVGEKTFHEQVTAVPARRRVVLPHLDRGRPTGVPNHRLNRTEGLLMDSSGRCKGQHNVKTAFVQHFDRPLFWYEHTPDPRNIGRSPLGMKPEGGP